MDSESSLVPGPSDLWFLPLGGTGEIGMNMNLFGHDGRWIMVDCGITFDEPLTPESQRTVPVVAADPSFISRQRERLDGIVITHGHEDHLGAVPYLWPRLGVPIYTTPFVAEMLRRKLAQHRLLEAVTIIEVEPNGRFDLGVFDLKFLPITHSIPQAQALLVSTPVGKIFHTADWKIDANPVIGEPFDAKPFKALAKENIRAMLCDSTNAMKPGKSESESICYRGILRELESAKGRIVVSCFSSNLARLITIAKAAQVSNRRFSLLGRSLRNIYSIARVTGFWPEDLVPVDERHLGYLPPEEVLAIATGSQGEQRSALYRLATGEHPNLELEEGDKVILSAFLIPGNEQLVARMIERFRGRGITVIESAHSALPIHASGHACQAELSQMYGWIQPEIAVPLHGEPEHMEANAEIAKKQAIPIQLRGLNGDLFELAPRARIHFSRVKTGRIPIQQAS